MDLDTQRSRELDDVDRLSRLLTLRDPVTGLLAAWCGCRIIARVEDRHELAAQRLTRCPTPAEPDDLVQHRWTTLCAQVRGGAAVAEVPIVSATAAVNLSRLPLPVRTELRETDVPLDIALRPWGITRVTRRLARRGPDAARMGGCVLEVEARLDLPAAGGGTWPVACVEEHYLAAAVLTGRNAPLPPVGEPVPSD